jgi:excinuclease ABC subunit C
MDDEESHARQPENDMKSSDSSRTDSNDFTPPYEKVRTFPTTPGVYLMKDVQGRVIYVGKAVNLRSRAGSYFTKAAEVEFRTAKLIPEIADIDYIDADSEVDALLVATYQGHSAAIQCAVKGR